MTRHTLSAKQRLRHFTASLRFFPNSDLRVVVGPSDAVGHPDLCQGGQVEGEVELAVAAVRKSVTGVFRGGYFTGATPA